MVAKARFTTTRAAKVHTDTVHTDTVHAVRTTVHSTPMPATSAGCIANRVAGRGSVKRGGYDTSYWGKRNRTDHQACR